MPKDKALQAAQTKLIKAAIALEAKIAEREPSGKEGMALTSAALTYGRQLKANKAAAAERRKRRRCKHDEFVALSPRGDD